MRLVLSRRASDAHLVTLAATIEPADVPLEIRYATRTGALARVDGVVAGAFDREHHAIVLDPSSAARDLTLEVERFTLPTNGLPSGDGLRWRLMLRSAHEEPQRFVDVLRLPSVAQDDTDASVAQDDTDASVAQDDTGASVAQDDTGASVAQDDSGASVARDDIGASGVGRGGAVMCHGERAERVEPRGTPLWGHSHLDVAWLWPYSQTRRKAMRTFANALAVIARFPSFVFMQSQPQLYAYVEADDAALFERVRERVREGTWSVEPAALWVEPDCNCVAGESLLRQMLYAHGYCLERFGIEPAIAWLPDTFGFPNTVPTLLSHARIPYFGTTKLQWNDTTRFPYQQFLWRGPDGSTITSAMLDAYEGGPDAKRLETARARREPLVIGYGDGGGGPTLEHVRDARDAGLWEQPTAWFARLDERKTTLPVHDDELYLEYHRGTYTTHHDVKERNASLERALIDLEERLAWCMAVRAPRDVLDRLVAASRAAWEVVLRNQFHDVLPGTSVPEAYAEALDEYASARELIDLARGSTDAMLPRAPLHANSTAAVPPRVEGDEFVFDNGLVHARVSSKGTLLELRANGGENLVAQANLLAAYRDRPKKWEAWNLDADYERGRLRVQPKDAAVEDDALVAHFDVAGSPLTMRIALDERSPFLRVDAVVDWRCDRTIVRLENWLTIDATSATYGSPHGTVTRSCLKKTPEERARFEVPGQRFAAVRSERSTFALLALDTYGWSARALKAGVHLGHSLLRSPRWPDPGADRGEQRLSWAFAPFAAASIADLERTWERFAMPPRVRLFTVDRENVIVTAVKPAHDGDGIIVRVRECDGDPGIVRIRCGGRMRAVEAVDGLERVIGTECGIEGEEIVATMGAFALRAFRVRL